VTVNGQAWSRFDPGGEIVRLEGLTGTASVVARY